MSRRTAACALGAGWAGLVGGCGGGGGDGAAPSTGPMATGTTHTRSLLARSNGTVYPLQVYVPPDSDGVRTTLPVVYLLDGESRFSTLVGICDAMPARVIVVAIGNEALRARDYVPQNACTAGGGGHVAFLDFIRDDLVPSIEANVGGDPGKRVLLGHSHGGSFVLYALFAETPARRSFASYLASDASVGCMEPVMYQWEGGYAEAHGTLSARLHVAWAGNAANVPFAERIASRRYGGLTMVTRFFSGGHTGMIPAAFADALGFALA